MANKYSRLSEQRVTHGISKGEFVVEQIGLVRDKSGAIVRHMRGQEVGPIPASVVQINASIIYEADIGRYVDALIRESDNQIAGDLAEHYEVVLGNLVWYRDHGDRLVELNAKSLDVMSIFKSRIDKFSGSIDAFLNDGDRNLNVINAYLNVIFIYVMSGYWLRRSKFTNDTGSRENLARLEGQVRSIYQDLLIANKRHGGRDFEGSVYAHLFLDKNSDIKLIDKLVKHDTRCESSLDFFESYRNENISREWSNGGYRYQVFKPNQSGLSVESRLHFSMELYEVLDKIDNIKRIIEELGKAGGVDVADIKPDVDFLQSPLSIFLISADNNEPDV